MRRSIEEQAEYMLEKMTVDMSIDFWQTKECAIAACDICIDAAQDSVDNVLITAVVIYWQNLIHRIQDKR